MIDIGIGIDIHALFYQVCVIDQNGLVKEDRIATGADGEQLLRELIESQGHSCVVAMEACTGAYHLYEVLRVTAAKLIIMDPRKMRERFPKRGKKTDKIDARNLASLAQFPNTTGNWIPTEETRRLRELTNERCRVTEHCTVEMNRVHAKLKEHGIKWVGASSKLWTTEGRSWLARQMEKAPAYVRLTINSTLERLDLLWKQRNDLESAICELTEEAEEAKLLRTLPGISAVGSAVILAEMGEWRRFENAKQLVSYAGLNPSVSQSGAVCSHGPITRKGRSNLRWICVELALSAHKHCPVLGAFHARIKKRTRCGGKAKVATGRKLLTLCWHILRSGQPYHHENAGLTKRKQALIQRVARKYKAQRELESGSS